jgi:hypothetical protein
VGVLLEGIKSAPDPIELNGGEKTAVMRMMALEYGGKGGDGGKKNAESEASKGKAG